MPVPLPGPVPPPVPPPVPSPLPPPVPVPLPGPVVAFATLVTFNWNPVCALTPIPVAASAVVSPATKSSPSNMNMGPLCVNESPFCLKYLN